MSETQSDVFWTWTDLAMFIALGGPVFVAVALLSQAALTAAGVQVKGLRLLIPQFAGMLGMLGPLALLFRWKYDRQLLPSIRWGVRPSDVLPSFALGIGLALAVLGLAALMRTPHMKSPMQDLVDDPVSAPWIAIFAVTIGPALEEILFRGLLQPVATKTIGTLGGIMLAAAPFALMHGPQYLWSWRHILLVFAAGAGFGVWRWRRDSTGGAAMMHAAYNGVLVVLYFFFGRADL